MLLYHQTMKNRHLLGTILNSATIITKRYRFRWVPAKQPIGITRTRYCDTKDTPYNISTSTAFLLLIWIFASSPATTRSSMARRKSTCQTVEGHTFALRCPQKMSNLSALNNCFLPLCIIFAVPAPGSSIVV